ncbi:iron-sulfur cluster assembly scaffold protein [Candidatus Bipolaricaulota bacterium]|nr:iron-sulfur cluster assembly scaffold protein [Candidatus Bipolaricaulota bacterium]
MYNEQVMEHFREPRNHGKLARYSAVGKVGNILCGDVMWMYILVERAENGEDIIADISWETFGCTAAIATSSMVSVLAKGKTVDEAITITNSQVAAELGGLPAPKMHCSSLAADALNEAIHEYFIAEKRPIPATLEQRHERIARHRKELEDRYAGFLDQGDRKQQIKGLPGSPCC